MTAKEQLQQLVAGFGEEQTSRAQGLLEPLAGELPDRRASRAWLAFIGIGDSGRTDASERDGELLAEGFGR